MTLLHVPISESSPEADEASTSRSARRFQFTGSLPETSFYIERPADRILPKLLREGAYCNVLAPRQIGKSSLRVSVARKLAKDGIRCVSVDLTAIGTAANQEEWYFGLIDEVARRLGFRDPAGFWEAHRSVTPARRWADYLRRVLKEELVGVRLVVFLDEIEAVRLVDFPIDDFFLSIRALHEERSEDEDLRRLTFCLFGVTTPNDLVKNRFVTPFNISEAVRLDDFTRSEMNALIPSLEEIGPQPNVLVDAIYEWTDGHPYMTMRACAGLLERGRVALDEARVVVDSVIREEFLERPLEDPNLNYAARRFDDPHYERRDATVTDKINLYAKLLEGERLPIDVENAVQMELRLSGMVKDIEDSGRRFLRIRNRIFSTALTQEWLRSKGDRRFIAESMRKWIETDKNPSYLLRDDALRDMLEWAETAILSENEQAFLAAGQAKELRDFSSHLGEALHRLMNKEQSEGIVLGQIPHVAGVDTASVGTVIVGEPAVTLSRPLTAIGARTTSGSVRDRIRELFLANVGRVLDRKQIVAAANGGDPGRDVENWHQRLSELRTKEGYEILSHYQRPDLRPGQYILLNASPKPRQKNKG